MVGCGGSAQETALATFQGTVLNADGKIEPRIKVTLVERKASLNTDKDGVFTFVVEPLPRPGTIEVTTDTGTQTFLLRSNPQAGDQLNMVIRLGDPITDSMPSIQELAFSPSFLGR